MQLSTILTTILQVFATSPDLCADVYVDADGQPLTDAAGQTVSRYCQPAGPDAPVLDADVCCSIDGDQAKCVFPDAHGRCSRDAKMYCEYGESIGAEVICYQRFPSACDFGFCDGVAPPGLGPFEGILCCWNGSICIEIATLVEVGFCDDNYGYIAWCDNGAQNSDGTVDCFD